ncbi:bifunctional purine biosynthetic protein ADE1 [Elsinoe australis]|uniref:Homoserine kinase n=1 Tax=Elsinoe australis TaxID=40998 RepID=A0A4U7AY83_9PEZI|nr:bifunctional purine biosynthetic protein ADE1 [Elsinoe australis]
MFSIKVPCSSANIGPGFDVIGLALSVWLEVQVSVDTSKTSSDQRFNCRITYEGQGKEDVELVADRNLITQTALYVLRCHDQYAFPTETQVHIINPIPLGRGLGSSGAAVVAGVVLANEVGKLGLTKDRLLDFCLMIERHPDNVAAALFGGFVGSYLKELNSEDMKRKEIPLSEVLPAPAGGEDTGLRPPIPPTDIGKHIKFAWAPEIKCIAIIPDFEVSTAKARSVLPTEYPKADVISNLQRIALLTTALGQSPPNPELIYDGMQDKVHQPYRKTLIPGLTEILHSVTPSSHPGLLGICLSGAGPTILALATHNFDSIASHIISQFKKESINCEWKLLTPAYDGATVTHSPSPSASAPSPEALTYASSGVSIDAGNLFVQRIKPLVRSTARPGADASIGGFGGALDLAAAGYGDAAPIIVQAIDGIGTKLKLAFALKSYKQVGIDLVAMNVNDLIVQGAEPLSFLDYYATGRLDVDQAAGLVEGVAEGCRQSNCALVGGETAEMPSLYAEGEFDAAGCATGAIHRGKKILPDMESMRAGDALIGLASSGVHSNGFSLVRKVVERAGLAWTDACPFETTGEHKGKSIGEVLLTPTKLYVKSLLEVIKKDAVKGMAHITGGGLYDNVPRMLPKHLGADIDAKNWEVPGVMRWLKKSGGVEGKEFARTWNTGLGMVCVVERAKVEDVKKTLEGQGERVFVIGKLVTKEDVGGEEVVVRNMEVWD